MAGDRSSSPDLPASNIRAGDGATVEAIGHAACSTGDAAPPCDDASSTGDGSVGPVAADTDVADTDVADTDVADTDVAGSDSAAQQRVDAKRASRNRSYVEWLIVIVVAMTSAFLVRAFVVQQFAVDGRSMMSTLHNGDRVLVNKLSYRLHDPNRGDVVVLKTIEGVGERDLIKRVVGLPGETVSYEGCVLRIDGRVVIEPYLDPAVVTATSCGPAFDDTVIEPKHVFVMGDNRGGSKDSRDAQVGQIAYRDLVGRAFVVIWPFGDWRWL